MQAKYEKKKILSFCILITLIIISYLQLKTTDVRSLSNLDNDEKRVHDMRLRWYNPSFHYLRLAFYRLDLKNFFEGNINIASFRIQRNFFESLDPNVYFFGGHPRERVWANDFEKFPFTYIFPFVIGAYQLIRRKNLVVGLWFICSVLLLSLIGHKNPLGPFIFFPIFIVTFWLGIPKNLPSWILESFLVLTILATVQTFIYAS